MNMHQIIRQRYQKVVDPAHIGGRTTMKWTRTGPLAPPLAPLAHSIAPHCSLRLRAPLRSFIQSLAHSLAPELMGKLKVVCAFISHSYHLCRVCGGVNLNVGCRVHSRGRRVRQHGFFRLSTPPPKLPRPPSRREPCSPKKPQAASEIKPNQNEVIMASQLLGNIIEWTLSTTQH